MHGWSRSDASCEGAGEPAGLGASTLVADVCADAGTQPPRLTWRARRGEHSTGVTRRGRRRGLGPCRNRSARPAADPAARAGPLALAVTAPPSWRVRRTTGAPSTRSPSLSTGATASPMPTRCGWSRAATAARSATLPPSGSRGAETALAEHRASLRARPRRRWRVLVAEHVIRLERAGRWTVCSRCGQRVVGQNLARLRRTRRPVRHVLMTSAEAS